MYEQRHTGGLSPALWAVLIASWILIALGARWLFGTSGSTVEETTTETDTQQTFTIGQVIETVGTITRSDDITNYSHILTNAEGERFGLVSSEFVLKESVETMNMKGVVEEIIKGIPVVRVSTLSTEGENEDIAVNTGTAGSGTQGDQPVLTFPEPGDNSVVPEEETVKPTTEPTKETVKPVQTTGTVVATKPVPAEYASWKAFPSVRGWTLYVQRNVITYNGTFVTNIAGCPYKMNLSLWKSQPASGDVAASGAVASFDAELIECLPSGAATVKAAGWTSVGKTTDAELFRKDTTDALKGIGIYVQ